MKRLFKDIAIYGAGDMVFRFLAFAVFPVYAHVFSVEQFGVLNLVTTLAGLIAIVLNMGLNNAVQRYYWDPQTPEEKRPALVTTGLAALIGWATLVTVVVLASLYPISSGIEQQYGIFWLLIVLALVMNIPSQVLDYSLDVLRLHFAPWRFTLLSGFKNLSGVLIGLILILAFGQGLAGYFWGLLLGFTMLVPLGLWLIRKELCWRFDTGLGKEIVLFGYPFIFAGLAYWIFGSMDRWMLGSLSNLTEVGLYSIAYKFAGIMLFVNIAFGRAWSPFAMKLYGEDPSYRQRFSRVFSLWFFALTALGTVISLFGLEVLRLTTPEAYWPAADTLGVLTMGVVLFGTTQITVLGISLERKTHLLAVATWTTAAVNVALNWLLIPEWGALGAGAATFISYAVLTGFYLYWTQSLHPIPLALGKLAFSLSLVFFVLILSFFFNSLEWSLQITAAKALICGLVLLVGMMVQGIRVSDFSGLLKRGIS